MLGKRIFDLSPVEKSWAMVAILDFRAPGRKRPSRICGNAKISKKNNVQNQETATVGHEPCT